MAEVQGQEFKVAKDVQVRARTWRTAVMGIGWFMLLLALVVGRVTDGGIAGRVIGIAGLVCLGVGLVGVIVNLVVSKLNGRRSVAPESHS